MRMKVSLQQSEKRNEQLRHVDNEFLEAELNSPVTAFQLRPDLAVCFWECATNDQQIFVTSFDMPVLRFSFILEGEGISTANNQDSLPRHRNLIETRFFPTGSGTYTLGANQSHKWVDIILKPSFLGLALPEETATLPHIVKDALNGGEIPTPCSTHRMGSELFVATSQLAHCPYINAARTLYLKSKTLELLSHVMAEQSPVICRTRLSSYEIECLKQAREMLTANLDSPPSIRQLSLNIGLSETKLKTGFKELFGQTVYGYFKTFRVNLGRKRLLESSDSISEIASGIGYTNISHFSAAFKERHGVTPSQYRRNNVFLFDKSKTM